MTAAIQDRKSGIYSARARFIAMAAFLVLVFAIGGSSRHDVPALVALRPLSALFLAYALAGMTADQWRAVRAPFLLLATLAVLVWAQLIPLPPDLWSDLPSRKPVAELGASLGLAELWRPLSLSPAKTWNALFSLLVPAAALALYAITEPSDRRTVWVLIVGVAFVSACIGVLQILGGQSGTLYFYSFTPAGFASGLFANRNHQGVFLATMIVVLAWWFASIKPRDRQATLKGFAILALLVFLVPMIFLTGSRAGLVCAVLALLFALWMISQAPLVPNQISLGKNRSLSRNMVLVGFAGLLAIVAAIVVASSRALALERFLADEELEGLRGAVFPTLQQMASEMAIWGAGFGSFEHVYKMYEPTELLGPKYLNNAHNDWIQFVIEGGLPAILILLVFVVAVLGTVWAAWGGPTGEHRRRRLMAFAVLALFGVGSLVDYPLRAPSIMALFAIACATLWFSQEPSQSTSSRRLQR